MITIVPMDKIDIQNTLRLVNYLNNDMLLLKKLGKRNKPIALNEFIDGNREWSRSRKAEMFAINLDGCTIGSISLSHQDNENKSARIGYWISSAYWGRGYTTKAFHLVLLLAQERNIVRVTASIQEDNIASRRIWESAGATIELINNRFVLTIKL